MKKRHLKSILSVVVVTTLLTGCSFFSKEESNKDLNIDESTVSTVVTPSALPTQLQVEQPNEALDLRLAFDKVKVGDIDHEGQGGTSLKELTDMFGNYTSKEDRKGGDVTINAYTWNKNGVVIVAQLYKDSTIARSISNFSFPRAQVLTLTDYNKLEKGLSFKKVVDILGEPDVMAQSVSSDGERVDAIWTSNLVSEEQNPGISLSFEDDKLASINQYGLSKE